jgi:hypothetical protein
MLETILQTRIPADMAQTVSTLANAEGLTVAAWLRRLIFKEVGRMRIEAWVYEQSERVNKSVRSHYILEPLSPPGSIILEGRLFHGRDMAQFEGRAVTQADLEQKPWNRERDKHRFHLEGEPQPWKIRRTLFDRSTATAIISLEMA